MIGHFRQRPAAFGTALSAFIIAILVAAPQAQQPQAQQPPAFTAAPGSNTGPFIMQPEGLGRLFALDKHALRVSLGQPLGFGQMRRLALSFRPTFYTPTSDRDRHCEEYERDLHESALTQSSCND